MSVGTAGSVSPVGLGVLRGSGSCVLPTPPICSCAVCAAFLGLRAESSIASNGINDYLLVLNAK